jgi:hypothetical protein
LENRIQMGEVANAQMEKSKRRLCRVMVETLVGYLFFQMGQCVRIIRIKIPTLIVGCGYIFVDPLIPTDQLGESLLF